MQNRSARICSCFSAVAFSLILALAFQSASFAQTLSTNFDSNIGSWVVSPTTDAATWGGVTTKGVGNSGCLQSSAVCAEGSSANSCVPQSLTQYYAASPSVSLTAGNTYQVALKCSVATASQRKALVGIHTSQQRSGATTLHDFGTITDNSGYQSYTYSFTVPTTGTYYMIFWGEQVALHSSNMWMDDFAVTVINSPPTASMSGPANNTVFNPSSMVNLQATVTDAESNVSKVEFYVNGSKVGEDATSPYSKTWMPTAGGTYTLTAKATDSYGLSHTSSSRTITVKSVPVVNLTYPEAEGTYPEGPMTFAATASDADGSITKVSFSLDEDFSTVHEDFTSPYTFDWTATPGSHSMRIEATDNEGYTNTSFGLFMEGIFFEVESNTCQLTGKKILSHTYYQTRQTLCAGGSASMGSTASVGSQSVQWLRKVGTGWQAVANATSNSFTTGTAGEYVAKWTYSNAATCTTAVDTVEVWNPGMNFAFDTAACAGHLVSLDSNYYRPPAVYSVDDNTQEIDTPQEPELNPTSPVTMEWQVPDFEFAGGGSGTLPLPTSYEEAWRGISYIRFGTPGPHQVKLIVTNNVLHCPANEHTITFTSKNVVVHAAPITTYNNQPALAVAHASGGTAPYQYSWSSMDTCLTADCDSVIVSNFSGPVNVSVTDAIGCEDSGEAYVNIIESQYISCGIDSIIESCITNDSLALRRFNISEYYFQSFMDSIVSGNAQRNLIADPNRDLIIPVVFHYVRNPLNNTLGTPIFRRAVFEKQILRVNTALVNTGIQLCLVTKFPSDYTANQWAVDNNGDPIEGVTYQEINGYPDEISFGFPDALRSFQFPTDRYFNIFITQSAPLPNEIDPSVCGPKGSISGLTAIPGFTNNILTTGQDLDLPTIDQLYNWDGMRILSSVFGVIEAQDPEPINFGICLRRGSTFVHEVGHYLNLLHTDSRTLDPGKFTSCPACSLFYCSNEAIYNHSRIFGDRIQDTPLDIRCPREGPASCLHPNSKLNCFGTVLPINYMKSAYTNTDDRAECVSFTDGQRARMRASLLYFRERLISDENMFETGLTDLGQCASHLGLSPTVEVSLLNPANRLVICNNESVRLHATRISGAISYQFTIKLGGTTQSQISSTTPTITYSPTISGSYDVSVMVDLDIVAGQKDNLFSVVACTTIAGGRKWYFGARAGLDFSSGLGNPSITPDLQSYGATSIVHKKGGQTLFYSDGINIYNRDNLRLIGLGNIDFAPDPDVKFRPRVYQGFLSLPYGGLHTSGDFFNNYSIVSTSDNYQDNIQNTLRANGLKSRNIVVTTDATTEIFQHLGLNSTAEKNYRTGAQLTAIPHWDNESYWIISHGVNTGTNMTFTGDLGGSINNIGSKQAPESNLITYLFKRGRIYGLDPTPSFCGEPFFTSTPDYEAIVNEQSQVYQDNVESVGQIRTNVQMTKVAVFSIQDGIRIYDFNNQTGALTNESKVFWGAALAGCFSFNGNILYFFERESDERIWLRSYNFTTQILSDNDIVFDAVVNPGFGLNPPPELAYAARGSMQLGPDKRIYVSVDNFTIPKGNTGTMSIICDPDQGFPNCGFVRNALDMIPGLNYFGLPQFVDGFLIDNSPLTPIFSELSIAPTKQTFCSNEAVLLNKLITPAANKFKWDVCVFNPPTGVDISAVTGLGPFESTYFNSKIYNPTTASLHVRYQVFASADGGLHYAAPEIFIVTILPGGNIYAVPTCDETGAFGIQVSHPDFTYNGPYKIFKGETVVLGISVNGTIPLWSAGSVVTNQEGDGYTFTLSDGQNSCQVSEPFQILGSAPNYFGLTIPGKAFVHSNLVLDGHVQIGPGAKVYNRGQASITGTGNEEAPVVEAIKWTVGGKQARFTLGADALITSPCASMWQGIEFTSADALDPLELNVSLGAKSEISHAYKAIHFTELHGNARLTAIETRFENNYIGFEAEQADLSGSLISKCTFSVNQSELKRPFHIITEQSHERTGRIAINLIKGVGGSITAPFVIDQSVISNYFIGINSYGSGFNLSHSLIENIRFKGINADVGYGNGDINLTDNHFVFDRSFAPMYGWMRYHSVPCCGNQNEWPGTPSFFLPELDHTQGQEDIPLGAIGISSRSAINEVSGNTFGCNGADYASGLSCISGIVADRLPTLTSNTFTNVDRGIVLLTPPVDTDPDFYYSQNISQNTFTNNLTGVYLDCESQAGCNLALNLKCNVFEAEDGSFGFDRIGVLIGNEIFLKGNRIGGNNQNSTGPPNSNYFPRNVNAITGVIEPFPGYFSVWNESANPINYYRFANEDVGNLFPENVSNEVFGVPTGDVTITRKNLEDWCNEGTPPNYNYQIYFGSNLNNCKLMTPTQFVALPSTAIPDNWKLACDGGPLDHIAFPIPRHAPANEETTNLIQALKENGVYLGQSIPNPASNKVTIPVMLPVLKGIAVLEVFDLSTGKALTSKVIPSFGQHMVEIDIRSWASGMYGYRVVLSEGKSPAPRKMVILR